MKMQLRTLSALSVAFALLFTSCKKEAKETSSDPSAEVQAHSDDQNNISQQVDAVADDANAALETNITFSGRLQSSTSVFSICGVTAVYDSVSNPRTITLTYAGNNCTNTHSRTGTVVLSMAAGTRWKNAGTAITVSFQNLKIKRLSDNKSITINGTQTYTNVTGGLLINLANLQNVIHTITSDNMSITFEDNSQRSWHVAHKRTFTYNNGVVISATGFGVTGGVSNATEWGTNRYGHSFVTSITSPLIVRQDCSFRLTAGEVKHEGFATAVATFGLNANGLPTTCPGTGNYYLKLVWTGPLGNSVTGIYPY